MKIVDDILSSEYMTTKEDASDEQPILVRTETVHKIMADSFIHLGEQVRFANVQKNLANMFWSVRMSIQRNGFALRAFHKT